MTSDGVIAGEAAFEESSDFEDATPATEQTSDEVFGN
jgi:hypothetical protein